MGFWDGSGSSWTICKQSAPRSTPTPHHSFLQTTCSSGTQPTVSEHWRQIIEQPIIKHCRFYFFLVFLFPIFSSWFCAVKLTCVSFWAHVKTAYLVIWYHCQYSTIPLLMVHLWHLVLILDSKLNALTGRGDCWLTEDKLDIRLYCLQCLDAVGWAAGRASGL